MATFDLSKPGAKAIRSAMGGGWIVPLNDIGKSALIDFFGEAPQSLAPLGNEKGYIVEPNETADLAAHLYECGVAWEIA